MAKEITTGSTSSRELLSRYSKSDITSLDDISKTEAHCLPYLIGHLGRDVVRAYLIQMLISLSQFYNVSNNMSNEQILETADLIMEDMWRFTVPDLILFLKKAKRGEYGPCWRLDGAVVMAWMRQYIVDRDNYFEARYSLNRSKVSTDEISGWQACPEDIKERLNELYAKSKT